MAKELSEMTLEELWQLFPIVLEAHNPEWMLWYLEQKAQLKAALSHEGIVRISHVGSTAIETIHAKPIVDILLELCPDCCMANIHALLSSAGWICMNQGEERMSFNKGYTKHGFAEKVFHLHVRFAGDNRELYFRDYLTDHPDAAREYEILKLDLWKRYEHDRDGYTNAKTEFIERYTRIALQEYMNRY